MEDLIREHVARQEKMVRGSHQENSNTEGCPAGRRGITVKLTISINIKVVSSCWVFFVTVADCFAFC